MSHAQSLPQMKLGMFYWPCGHHIAAWRHPDAVPDSGGNIAHLIELAKLAERGLFDMFFMANSVTFWRGSLDSMMRDSYGAWIEPFTLMCALAQHTTHLGLVCTSTTTYDQPYLLARRFASLDLASGGRAGWNLVTSGNRAEAVSFGLAEHMDKATRYRRAREFAHVVRGCGIARATAPSCATRSRASISTRTSSTSSSTRASSSGCAGRSTCRPRRRASRCWCRPARRRTGGSSPPRRPRWCSAPR